MKKTFSIAVAVFCCLTAAQAQKNTPMAPKVMTDDDSDVPPPPPAPYIESVAPEMPPPSAPVARTAPFVYDQKLWGPGPQLIAPDEAQVIVDNFRSNYAKLGNPRILIYVNRNLVDDQSGLKLSARTEQVDTTRTVNNPDSTNADRNVTVTSHSTANNTYSDSGNNSPTPTLADRQTVRDVERLMGGPFRAAGAALVDQRVAAQMMGDRTLDSLTLQNDQARKDREAVNKIADVALEVLITSRQVNVTELAGDRTYTVPDIQVTAIRLSDAKLIGQASAADVINKSGGPGFAARNFGVESITEATALALMEDMTGEAK